MASDAGHEDVPALLAVLPYGVMALRRDGTLAYTNAAALAILGLTRPPRGRYPFAWAIGLVVAADGAPLPPDARPVRAALRTGEPRRGVVVGIMRPDGERRWLLVDAAPVRDDAGAVARVVASFVDITAREEEGDALRRQVAALRRQVLHDPLTGLPNRTLLQDRLEQGLRMVARDGVPLALLLMDLDRFKGVNDTLGHHVGDALLHGIAGRLRGALRDADTVARLGGDEFAVLLPETGLEGARRAAATALRALADPVEIEGRRLAVGVSIGVALAPAHGRGVADLLRRADIAMYAAKRAGCGYRVYDAG